MSLWALIPAKNLARAKSRLAHDMSPEARHAFALRTLEHVIDIALSVPAVDRCLVISAAQEALDTAARRGATAVQELPFGPKIAELPGTSLASSAGDADTAEDALNRALEQSRDLAIAGGATAVLVLAADLPLIDADALSALVDTLGADTGVVLAPDRHGTGTNALLMRPPQAVPFAFGPNSLERHMRLARERRIDARLCNAEGLALDVDTIEDVRAFLDSPICQGFSPHERCRWFGSGFDGNSMSVPPRGFKGGAALQGRRESEEHCAHGS